MTLIKQYPAQNGFYPTELWEHEGQYFYWSNDGLTSRPSSYDYFWQTKFSSIEEAEE